MDGEGPGHAATAPPHTAHQGALPPASLGPAPHDEFFDAQPDARPASKSPANPRERTMSIPPAFFNMGLTPEELDKFVAFTELAQSIMDEFEAPDFPELVGPFRLIRFLIGHQFDLEAAADAYRNHLKWRNENGIDQNMRDFIQSEMLTSMAPEKAPHHEKVSRHFPVNMLLRLDDNSVLEDKEGNIIGVERPGLLDEKRLQGALTEEEFLLWHCYQLEFRSMLLDRRSRERMRLVRTTLVMDLTGLSVRCLSKPVLSLLRQLVVVASENYPEGMRQIFFINVPKVFQSVWGTLKGWLRPRTVQKVELLDGNYSSALFTLIDPSSLPPFLGGQCSAELAGVRQGGLLSLDPFNLGANFKQLGVPPRRREVIEHQVSPPCCVLWAWGVLDGEISFSLTFDPDRPEGGTEAPDAEVIIDSQRYDATKVVRGMVEVARPGNLVFAWDNCWSLFAGRAIHHKIGLAPTPDRRGARLVCP
eukprot:GHVT01064611.1.p1 GENE.GHVT01064611.1~~GHVT01064611.1.p1  ORF type:complete len:475 (+),score=105.42 GHVT01064611.1:110-1534(+)